MLDRLARFSNPKNEKGKACIMSFYFDTNLIE